jgi:hypothetical protein
VRPPTAPDTKPIAAAGESRLSVGAAELLFLCVLLSAVVFAVNAPVQGLMIQADEDSYLANAAAISGYPNDMASSHQAGYSSLLAPAFATGAAPEVVWQYVRLTNALLLFLLVSSLSCIATLAAPHSLIRSRLTAVAITAAYPMWVVMAG